MGIRSNRTAHSTQIARAHGRAPDPGKVGPASARLAKFQALADASPTVAHLFALSAQGDSQGPPLQPVKIGEDDVTPGIY